MKLNSNWYSLFKITSRCPCQSKVNYDGNGEQLVGGRQSRKWCKLIVTLFGLLKVDFSAVLEVLKFSNRR